METIKAQGEALAKPRPPAIVVVPVYNSVNSLPVLVGAVGQALGADRKWSIVFVDDRSPNAATWPAIKALVAAHDNISGVRLLKNRGRGSAVFAGLAHAQRLDPQAIVVVMDDDLQHDPADIPRLLEVLAKDRDVDAVLAQFRRKQHGAIARFGSWAKSGIDRYYYGLPREVRMSSFVALDPRVAAALTRTVATVPLFGPQLIKVAGCFAGVECTHAARHSGVAGYTLAKRLRQLYSILLSDTVLLLVLFTRIGLAMAATSLVAAIYFAIQRLVTGTLPEGWTSLFVTVTFLGGLNMTLLGLIGANVVRSKENIERMPAWTVREAVGPGSRADLQTIETAPNKP